MRRPATKGTSQKLVAPHELSSELLLRVWRQNRASALACLDQPQILRYVLRTFRDDAQVAKCVGDNLSRIFRIGAWSRVQARTGPSDHSAYRQLDSRAELIEQFVSSYCRTALHVWCANEERHALLEACSWSSAVLAAQRREADAAAGEARY